MVEVETVRELDGFMGDAVLVKKGGEFFVVSSVDAMFSGFETLVFPADAEGKVTDWGEVAGGRGMNREEAIADLASADRTQTEGGD